MLEIHRLPLDIDRYANELAEEGLKDVLMKFREKRNEATLS